MLLADSTSCSELSLVGALMRESWVVTKLSGHDYIETMREDAGARGTLWTVTVCFRARCFLIHQVIYWGNISSPALKELAFVYIRKS